MTQPVPYQQYPSGAPQPQFWPELVAIMIDIAILAVIFSWAFSQIKKAIKGEEVKLPGG
jgi:uncharacterized membrane protein